VKATSGWSPNTVLFLLPATLLSHFPRNFLTACLGVCRHHTAISKFQKRVSINLLTLEFGI
jgi:hypothetical protein